MSNLSKCLHVFFSEFLNAGVKHVVISPGSRNFPIIKTVLAANKFITAHSAADERSAAFIALGLAQQTQTPVVVCCTSGTASLNLYPAIAESFYSETPLLVLTADRPAASIDNWEGQCIRQDNVFDIHTIASFVTPEDFKEAQPFKQIGLDAVSRSISLKGPVHVNMPFQEPFYTNWGTHTFSPKPTAIAVQDYHAVPVKLIEDIKSAKALLWLNGASRQQRAIKYPDNLCVWSDVIANANETQPFWESIVEAYDEVALPTPDTLITTGAYCVSKKLKSYLRNVKNLTHWHIGNNRLVGDPFHSNPITVHCDQQEVASLIKEHYVETKFDQSMHAYNAQVSTISNHTESNTLSELSAIQMIYNELPPNAIVHLANSMPIRYVAYLNKRADLNHLANRGTSGIDGCTSTAVGCALATEKAVFLFTGDIAFLYDINALWQSRLPANLRIVIFNNQGGGIFELIEGPDKHQETLPWQTTDHNRSISELANHFDLDYSLADSTENLKPATTTFMMSDKPSILEIKTDRGINKDALASYKKQVIQTIQNGG